MSPDAPAPLGASAPAPLDAPAPAPAPAEPWDAASVRGRVDAMARADPGRQRFGASDHGYRLRPPLPGAAIRAFERLHGVVLPPTYRAFLEEVAEGGAGPDYGLLGLTEEVPEDEALHDVRAECLRAGVLATPFPHTGAWAGPGKGGKADYSVAGTLVVSDMGCGIYRRLVVTGSSAGQVWIDDRDWGGLTPGPDFGAWYRSWLASG